VGRGALGSLTEDNFEFDGWTPMTEEKEEIVDGATVVEGVMGELAAESSSDKVISERKGDDLGYFPPTEKKREERDGKFSIFWPS